MVNGLGRVLVLIQRRIIGTGGGRSVPLVTVCIEVCLRAIERFMRVEKLQMEVLIVLSMVASLYALNPGQHDRRFRPRCEAVRFETYESTLC